THVLTQGQLAHINGRSVRQDVPARNLVAHFYDGALVDAGVLVGTGVLREVVDIYTRITTFHFVVVDPNYDTARVNALNDTTVSRNHTDAGIRRHDTLHASTYQRLFSNQCRYRLTLHVGTHQGAVSIVVLQERNQRGSHGHHLA